MGIEDRDIAESRTGKVFPKLDLSSPEIADTGTSGASGFDGDGSSGVSSGFAAPTSPSGAPIVAIEASEQSWTSADPAGWSNVSSATKSVYGFSTITAFKSRANLAAEAFREANGRWPSASELLNDPTYQQYVGNLAAGMPYFPPVFAVDQTTYYNDPLTGPQPFNTSTINSTLGPGEIDQLLNSGELNNSGVLSLRPQVNWTMEQFQALRQQLAPARGGGRGGGGGGGGGGRAARVFDRDQLIEASTDRWKGLLYEDPTEQQIGGLVDSYINKSQAFWMGQGGNLDFDTYIVNQMRKQPRHKLLYQRKDAHLTEEEWMMRYRPVVEQFGLNSQATRREVESGLVSGAGQAGFTERVSRTREARNADGGAFSRRVAAGLASMGRLG